MIRKYSEQFPLGNKNVHRTQNLFSFADTKTLGRKGKHNIYFGGSARLKTGSNINSAHLENTSFTLHIMEIRGTENKTLRWLLGLADEACQVVRRLHLP